VGVAMEVACEDDGEEMVWKAEGRTKRKQKRPGKTKQAIPPLLYENQDTDRKKWIVAIISIM
jgi:hypothetical protein